VRHQLVVGGAHRAHLALDLRHQALLGLAPAEAGAQLGAEGRALGRRGEGVEERHQRHALGLLGLARLLGVGDDARHRLAQRAFAALEQRNDVVVALAHLAAVEAGSVATSSSTVAWAARTGRGRARTGG
jgi:hypothetical protein